MKKILIGIGVLVVLVIAAALIIPAFIPLDTYKRQLLTQVESATGRKAAINGDFSLSLLPSVEFVAGDVTFANAPGGQAEHMATLERLDVQVAVWPLLGGNVEIDSFVLERPVINLEVDKSGKPNWQFQTAAKPAGQPAPAPKEGEGGDGGFGLSGLRLGDVRLVNGQVSYSDARTGASYTIGEINMRVALESLTSPVKADGSFIWNEKKVALALGLSSLNDLMEQKPTDIDVDVSSGPMNLSFDGSAEMGKALKAGGKVNLDIPSVRQLAAWAGTPLEMPGEGFGPLKIAGDVAVDGQRYAFNNAKIGFDEINGTGNFAFDGGGKKPFVSAKLDLDTLDVNPYLPPEQAGGQAGGDTKPAGQQAGAEGWSEEPIDLSALNAANAEMELTVGGLIVRKIKIGESNVKVTLKDGVLVTDLTKMALYEGNGTAKLTANGAGDTPAVELGFDLAGVQANPLLSDAMELDRIEGKANADLQVKTQGRSQRDMISALKGAGQVKFLDGAIRGINLAAMVRNVSSAFLDPKAREQQKTDFAELGGTYKITNGIVANDDLLLLSPLLRLAGKGTVNLPERTMKYRIEPKLVATTEGQGGQTEAAGLKVPVIVEGPWSNLSYKPDLSAVVKDLPKDPEKALEKLKEQVPDLKLPGGSGSSGSGDSPDPAETLKKLFGR